MMKLLLLLGLGNLGLSGFILYNQLINLRKERNMNQQRVKDLTEQLRAGNDSAEAAAAREKDEVAAAINNPNIDTSELEAEIARNANLAALFEGIYTPPADTGSTDTGSADTGSTETGSTDSGSTDAGSTDSGAVPTETGAGDSGSGDVVSETPADSGSTESGSTDAGTSEAPADTASDAGAAPDFSEAPTAEFPAAETEGSTDTVSGSDTTTDPDGLTS
jgi:hypothetical protein